MGRPAGCNEHSVCGLPEVAVVALYKLQEIAAQLNATETTTSLFSVLVASLLKEQISEMFSRFLWTVWAVLML